jgi:hypothetical protein
MNNVGIEHALPDNIRALITVGSNFDLEVNSFEILQKKLNSDYKGGAYFVDFMFPHLDYAEDFVSFLRNSGEFRKEEVKLKYLDWEIGKTIPNDYQDVAWAIVVLHRKNFDVFYRLLVEYVKTRKVAFTPIYD